MSEVQINESILRILILDIFNDLNIPPSGRLTLSHLESEWEKSGLRLDDLARGVHALIADEDLVLRTVEEVRCAQLTEKGYQHMTAPPSPAVLRDRVLASRAVSQAQKRKRAAEKAAAAITRSEDDDLGRRLRALPDA